jgi:hypothetical protein
LGAFANAREKEKPHHSGRAGKLMQIKENVPF